MKRLSLGVLSWVLMMVLSGPGLAEGDLPTGGVNKLDCTGFLSEPDADFDAELAVLLDNLEPFLGALILKTADLDESGIPDQAELALLVYHLTGHLGIPDLRLETICQFEANKALWLTDELSTAFGGMFAESPNAVPALMSMSPSMNAIFQTMGAQETYPVIRWPGGSSAPPPFSIHGDADRDGITNMQEWQNVITSDRRLEDYILAATYPGLDGGNSLPASSGSGLLLLGGLLGVAGLGILRRRAT